MTVHVNGQLIRQLRIKHSYSQERLAEIVGVNLRTIQRIETNGAAALSTRGALARALGVEPEDLDVADTSTAAPPWGPDGKGPRWSLLLLSAILAAMGATLLAISVKSSASTGLVALPTISGFFLALIGLVILTRLTPLAGSRVYAVLCIIVLAMAASPPGWTVRALVAISLCGAFELGVVLTRLGPRLRHS